MAVKEYSATLRAPANQLETGRASSRAGSIRDNFVVKKLGFVECRLHSRRDDAGAEEDNIFTAYEYFMAESHGNKCARRASFEKPSSAIQYGEGGVAPRYPGPLDDDIAFRRSADCHGFAVSTGSQLIPVADDQMNLPRQDRASICSGAMAGDLRTGGPIVAPQGIDIEELLLPFQGHFVEEPQAVAASRGKGFAEALADQHLSGVRRGGQPCGDIDNVTEYRAPRANDPPRNAIRYGRLTDL